MLASRRTLSALILAFSLSPLACAGEVDEATVPDHHDEGEGDGPIGTVSSKLAPTDTVGAAIASTACATSVVKGLSVQLVEEIQCLRPNTFTKIAGTPGLSLGSSVMPYLQTGAAQALIAAQKARGTTMSINSAMRTLPQQYLLYRWYQTGRCGIGLAASPGTSNHEGAIAVDINDNAGWRTSLQAKGFRWLGAGDPVHYDFVGGGTVNLSGLSVKAFQRLWNRNHPGDTIIEDGDYGPATASRLSQAPIGGFAKGASCIQPAADAGAGTGTGGQAGDAELSDVPIVPDANETDTDTEGAGDAPPPPVPLSAPLAPAEGPAPAEGAGCAITREGSAPGSSGCTLGLGLAVALVLAERRRARAGARAGA